MRQKSSSEQAFILVAVLWLSLLLSVIALTVSGSARLQGIQAMNINKWYEDLLILESGIEIAKHEYQKFQDNRSMVYNKEEIEQIAAAQIDFWYPRFEPYKTEVMGRELQIRLVNRGGKININNADLQILKQVLIACGVPEGVKNTAIVNSILDWKDKDDLRRAEGAENDYYQSLSEPYEVKNNDFSDLSELLLVKGIDPDLFQGTEEHPGLVDFFTVYGESHKLDINSVSLQTFAIVGDVSGDVLQQIREYRENQPVAELSDISHLIPQEHYSLFRKYYQINKFDYLGIDVHLVQKDQQLGRKLSATYKKNEIF